MELKNLKKLSVSIILFYIFIILIILAIGVFSYNSLKKRLVVQKSKEISSIAELKVQQIVDFRQRIYRDGLLFRENNTFIQTVKTFIKKGDSTSESAIADWLNPLLNNRFYDEIIVVDAATKRKVLSFAYNNLNLNSIIEQTDLNCLESDSIIIGDFTLNHTENRIQLCIYVPLILKTQSSIEKVAVVKLVLNPYNKFYSLIQSMPEKSKTGEVLVVKKDKSDVLFLNELRFLKNTALNLRLPIASKDLPAARALLGNESVSEGIDYRGVEVLAVARLIPGTDWSLVVKYDTEEIFEDLKTTSKLIAGMVLALLIASAFGLIAIWRRRKLKYYKSKIHDLRTIHRLSHVYKLLSEINHAIVKSNEKEVLLCDVCEVISSEGSYSLCWIGLVNIDTGYMESFTHCGVDKQFFETIKITTREKFKESNDISVKTIIEGKHFISNNIWTDPAMEKSRETIPAQFKSLAAFPLIVDSVTIGALYFYANKIDFFIQDEIELLEVLSADLSHALDKIELEKNEKISIELLFRNEVMLKNQNDELLSLNEEYISTNDELHVSLEKLETLNKELIVAREKAEESDQFKSAFLANMSHEIRTPMNAIIGFAELLENTNVTTINRKDYCEIIINRSNDLLQIINDILDISKIDSRTVSLYRETISFNKFLDELQLIYLNKLERMNKKEIKLICKKPPGFIEFNISTDVLKFRQIFTNLLENAIKFTDSGHISFGYYKHNTDQLMCFVSDTGIGIDHKHHDQIFKIFTQAEDKSKRNFGGTGLGLAISKGNAQLLGGDICVDSEPDKGSVFYFTINYTEKVGVDQRLSKTKIKLDQMKQKSVLLVEDDLGSIEYLKYLFKNSGVNLHIAHNGKETEQFYDKLDEFDMVLLDVRLPDISGFELVKQFKTLRKELPVIAQTAFGLEDDKKRCMDAGFDDYIAKPYKGTQLMDLINSY